MPHSSGGGSHGGGSHGGGSHGGSHGGGGSIPSVKVRKSDFAGARRYVYYRHKKPVYIYTDDKKINDHKLVDTPWVLIFYIPFLIAIFGSMKMGLYIPHRIPMNYSNEIVIEDQADVLGEYGRLSESMEAFQNATGITPVVLTVNNEDWMDNYSSLENYAYEAYVRRFDDEKHWLIVYSQPLEPYYDWVEWYWEGMQGDDTDSVLTEEVAQIFNDTFQKGLYNMDTYTVGASAARAFNAATAYASKVHLELQEFLICMFVLAFICVHAYFMAGVHPKALVYRKAKPVPKTVTEDTCQYCQGVYVVGTCIECPHCGAHIVSHGDIYNG